MAKTRFKTRKRVGLGGALKNMDRKNSGPVIKLTVLLVSILGAAALIIFVAIPFVSNLINPPDDAGFVPPVVEDPLSKPPVVPESPDISMIQNEAIISLNSINDPFFFGNQIVFSTSTVEKGIYLFNRVGMYDVKTGQVTFMEDDKKVCTLEIKYENIIGIRMNENYLVYLDSNSNGGGRICALDRNTSELIVVKEYAYGLPKISLSENMIAFMQQSGNSTDKLFIYDLKTRESACLRTFSDMPAECSSVYLDKNMLVYSYPVVSEGNITSVVCTQFIGQDKPKEVAVSRLAVDPQCASNGKYVAFMNTNRGPRSDIYMMTDGASPKLIIDDVVNFAMGDGFIAFTKGDAVWVYILVTGEIRRLSTDVSRALLNGVYGKNVWWYDVTGGSYGEVDVVKYAVIEISTINAQTEVQEEVVIE